MSTTEIKGRPLRSLFVVAILSIALLWPVSCVDEGAVDNDGPGGIVDDRGAPTLQDLDSLTEGTPENEALPEEAKADQIFPRQFDLVDTQSPVREQGARGLCSIFSTISLMEHLYIKEGTKQAPNFSEQYLQWALKVEQGSYPEGIGSNARHNLKALYEFGVPQEQYWPYEPDPWGPDDDPGCQGSMFNRPVQCYTNGDPPQEALDAPKYFLPEGRWISTRPRDLKAQLYNKEEAVVVGGDFFHQAWNHVASPLPTSVEYWRKGYVLYPNEADKEASRSSSVGHAILLVGWDDDLEVERLDANGEVMRDEEGNPETEKGFFIFKNSWGTDDFGRDNEYGAGYGYISYEYVRWYMSGRVAAEPEPHHFPYSYHGALQCEDDQLACEAECVPEDAENCGSCGNSCDAGDHCVAGSCVSDDLELELFEYDGGEVPIPDYDPDSGPGSVTLDLEVAGAGLIEKLLINLEVEHTYRGDLQIELIHPDGTSVTLHEADGSMEQDIILHDLEVEQFDGTESQGIWRLRASDHMQYHTGTIKNWSLQILR